LGRLAQLQVHGGTGGEGGGVVEVLGKISGVELWVRGGWGGKGGGKGGGRERG